MARRKTVDVSTSQSRFDEAVKDLKQFREEWNRIGRPMLTGGSNGQFVVHPLIRAIRDAEAAVLRLGQVAGVIEVNRGGRPVGSGSAPDRRSTGSGSPGRTRLRVVGD